MRDSLSLSEKRYMSDSLPEINHRNNFDLLRLLFASTVFLYHVSALSQHPDLQILKDIFRADIALNGFFIISGFLVFMSFENSKTVAVYFEKRLRRIYPAYFGIIFLCATLGYLLSTDSFAEYYLSNKLVKYFIVNAFFLNFIEPGLPGVFAHNHLAAINGSLWTIRNEIMCYMLVPLVAYFLRRYNRITVFVFIYICAYLAYALLLIYSHAVSNSLIAKLYYIPWHFLCFISGAVLYYSFELFKSKSLLFLILALLIYTGGSFLNITFLKPISLAVIVVSAASFWPYLGNFVKFGDLSYGIYIIHFPIVQILISSHIFNYSPLLGLFIAITAVFLLSTISWHLLERPFLKRSSHYIVASKQRQYNN